MQASYEQSAFLGVENSLRGRYWRRLSLETRRLGEAISQAGDWPDGLCLILAERGVAPEEIPAFLNPRIKDLLPDPRQLKDVQKAATCLVDAALGGKKIAIFADYDVDGAASAALVFHWLYEFGLTPTIYVPDRVREGYGPNVAAMEKLASAHDLVICVDCGTAQHEAIAAAHQSDVIIMDHHLGAETLAPAHAVVNPNRFDEDGEFGYLAAAGVVFLTLVEANRVLKERAQNGPNLIEMLDLVALASVADVVPLIGVNRAFVRQGLKIMRQNPRVGLSTLIKNAGLNAPLCAEHLGFFLGPRLNAGGRIGPPELAAQLLCSRDEQGARAIAEQLEELNTERRAIEARVTDEAIAQAEVRGFDGALVWAASEGWHEGIIGIIAAQLREASGKPSFVISLSGGMAKGSGRSSAGIDLGASVIQLVAEGKLSKGGGHAMAAGLSVERAKLEEAMARLSELLARQSAGQEGFDLGARVLSVTGMIMPAAVDVELITELEKAGPFGSGAPAPCFVFPDQHIFSTRRVGENHLKLSFGADRVRMDTIAFGAFKTPLGAALEAHNQRPVHLAGRLELNHWQGQVRPQLRLEDAAFANQGAI